MRSDIDDVRRAVQKIQTQQLAFHETLKRRSTEPRLMAIVCFCCALVSIGCAVVGLK